MSKQLCELGFLKHILKYRLPPWRPSPIRRMSGLPIRSNGTAMTSSAAASIPRSRWRPSPALGAQERRPQAHQAEQAGMSCLILSLVFTGCVSSFAVWTAEGCRPAAVKP
jgi:hypothetical protein